MLKKITAITLMLALLLSFQIIGVYAEETTPDATAESAAAATAPTSESTTTSSETTEVKAGITPDSPLYKLDRLIEDIKLALVTDAAKKAELLVQMAQERLAESKSLLEADKTDLGEKTLSEYKELMVQAVSTIETAVKDGKIIAEKTEKLVKQGVGNNSETLTKILEKAPEQYKEELKQTIVQAAEQTKALEEAKKDEALKDIPVIKDVLSRRIQDQALLQKVLDSKLNLRQVTALLSFSEQSGKSLDEVLAMFMSSEKGLGATAQKLGLEPKKALKEINKTFKELKSEAKTVLKQEALTSATEDVKDEDEDEEIEKKAEKEKDKLGKKLEKKFEIEKKKLEKMKEKAEREMERNEKERD